MIEKFHVCFVSKQASFPKRPPCDFKPNRCVDLNRDRDDNNNLISSKMFYDGDLQSGITKAVQESKLVACFVTGISSISFLLITLVLTLTICSDDGEESKLWEDDFLQDEIVSFIRRRRNH